MRYKASPSPNDSRSNQGPTRIVFLSHYLIAVEHRSSRPSAKEPIMKTTRPESRPLPTIASLSACKANDLLITQTERAEEKWTSITIPAAQAPTAGRKAALRILGAAARTLILQDAAGCRSFCCILLTSARRWWSLLFGGVFVVVFSSFFSPLLLRFQGFLGLQKPFFFYSPEFMHWLAEGSLEACQGHLAMHSVNYSSEKNVRCWEGVIRLYWCIHFGGQMLLLTHSGMTWHLFTLTRRRGGNDELPGLAAHEDRTPKLLLSTEGTHRVVWAGRDP